MKRALCDIVNPFLSSLGLNVIRKKDLRALKNEREIYLKIINVHNRINNINRVVTTTEGIVFSKDRAIQLHALFASYFEKVKDPVPIHIIYSASTKKHEEAYAELFEIFI